MNLSQQHSKDKTSPMFSITVVNFAQISVYQLQINSTVVQMIEYWMIFFKAITLINLNI